MSRTQIFGDREAESIRDGTLALVRVTCWSTADGERGGIAELDGLVVTENRTGAPYIEDRIKSERSWQSEKLESRWGKGGLI